MRLGDYWTLSASLKTRLYVKESRTPSTYNQPISKRKSAICTTSISADKYPRQTPHQGDISNTFSPVDYVVTLAFGQGNLQVCLTDVECSNIVEATHVQIYTKESNCNTRRLLPFCLIRKSNIFVKTKAHDVDIFSSRQRLTASTNEPTTTTKHAFSLEGDLICIWNDS